MRLSESKVEARWRSRLRVSSPFVVLAIMFIFTVGFFAFVPTLGSIRGQNGIYCTLGNNPRVGKDPNAIDDKWAPSRFLWISLGFGNFSFAAAKGIDVVWDLAIGRGGQLLLIYLTYPIIRRSLLRAMVMFPIRLPMYASIAFDKVSLWTIWAAMRNSVADSARVQGLQDPVERKGLTILWFLWQYFVIIPILAYILAFPTMMAIMTGYQTEPEPYVLRPGSTGDLMKASLLDIPPLVVLDGSRIGLPDMVAVRKDDTSFANLSNYQSTYSHFQSRAKTWQDRPSGSEGISIDGGPFTSGSIHTYCHDNGHATSACYFQATEYVAQAQGGCGTSDCSGILYTYLKYKSTLNFGGQDYTLDPPLSIAVNGSGFDTQYYSVDNVAVNTTYIMHSTRCQPSETYIWGFSYLMLFVFCFVTLIFTFVLSCVYLDTYHNSQFDPFQQPASMYRDILDLAREIKRVLGEEGENISTEELNRRIEKDTTSIELDTDSLFSRREQKELRRRRRDSAEVRQLREKNSV